MSNRRCRPLPAKTAARHAGRDKVAPAVRLAVAREVLDRVLGPSKHPIGHVGGLAGSQDESRRVEIVIVDPKGSTETYPRTPNLDGEGGADTIRA